eukprot:gene36764-47928_t
MSYEDSHTSSSNNNNNNNSCETMAVLCLVSIDSHLDLDLDPWSSDAWTRPDLIRTRLSSLGSSHHGMGIHLVNTTPPPSFSTDTSIPLQSTAGRHVQAQMVWVAVMVLAAIVLIVGQSFQSPSVAFQVCFSSTLKLILTYGLVALFHRLGWTRMILGHGHGEGHCLSGMICLPLVIVQGVGSDFYLLSRIIEYRGRWYTAHSSLLKGMYRSWRTVAAAGVVSFAALLGLFLSSCALLRHIGLLLSVSVLVDAFLVNPVVVPLGMNLAGQWAWWPRYFPGTGNADTIPIPDLHPDPDPSYKRTITSNDESEDVGFCSRIKHACCFKTQGSHNVSAASAVVEYKHLHGGDNCS